MAPRQCLQTKSFDLAADAYAEAVGGRMSSDSLRRVAEGWGEQVETQRVGEANAVFAVTETGERADRLVVAKVDPIATLANLSTDGGMMLVRGEGWKEAKLSVISAVSQSPAPAEAEPERVLRRHSYQAGLWDADTMGHHPYLEGLRRGIGACQLSSANDGAVWIERITATNYPQAVQILDWGMPMNAFGKSPRRPLAKAPHGPSNGPKPTWNGSGRAKWTPS